MTQFSSLDVDAPASRLGTQLDHQTDKPPIFVLATCMLPLHVPSRHPIFSSEYVSDRAGPI